MAWQPPAGLAQCQCFLARCVSSLKHSCHFVQPTVAFYDKASPETARAGHRLGCHCHDGSSSGSSVMHLCSPCEAPSTSCLFQQQAVDVFREQKKKPRGCATGPEHGPLPPPLPCLPNVQHSCICNQEMIGENRSLHCNSFSKLALRVHNHHSAAQCKMLFSSVLLRHCTVHCKDCHVHFQDTGTFLARAFEALLRFFTGHGWRFFLTQEWTFLTTEKP